MTLFKRPDSKILSDLLPYLHFDKHNDALWLKDGSCTRAVELVPKSVLSLTEDELEALRSGLTDALGQVPEGALLQFIFVRERTTEDTDLTVQRWKVTHVAKDSASIDPAHSLLFDSKLELLREAWKAGQLFQSRIYLTIRITPDLKSKTFKSLGPLSFLAFGRAPSRKAKGTAAMVQELNEAFGAIKLGLESQGFETRSVESEDYGRTLFRFLNPERAALNPNGRTGVEWCADLSEAVSVTDFIESKKGISLGRTRVRIGTLKNLPKQSYPGLMTLISSAPEEFTMIFTILVLPQTKEKERLSRKQRLATGMAAGNAIRNLTAESVLEDTEETLSALIAGEKIFACSFHIVSFEAPETEDYRFQQLLDTCERMGEGCQWFEETVGAYLVFFGILPFAPTFITRPKRVRSTHLTDLFPIYGIGPGHDEASVIFETPYKSLLGFSLFEKSPSANGIIIGSTGSGKSTLACGLILGMMAEGLA